MALNLVKLQEDLKLMPYERIVAYANGANPDVVPPYMATIESQRRAKIAKQAEAEQAQAAVGAPTIKDQLNQSAGLMALQAQQQPQQQPQVAPQQMAQAPQMPQGMPQGAPQQAPVMAAGGGLMELPLRPDMFARQDFAGGGIVAFNGEEESYVNDPYQYQAYRSPGYRTDEFTDEERRAKEDFLEALKYTYGKTLGPIISLLTEGEPLQKTAAKPTRPEDRKDLPQADYSLEGRNYPAGTRREPPTNRVIDVDGTTASDSAGPIARPTAGGATRAPVNPELAYFRKRYNEAEPDYMEMLRKAGLDKPPETQRELELAKKQLADYAARSDTFTSRLMALQPGRFSSGVTGRSLAKYEEGRQANIDRINMLIAKSEDLNDKAAFEFRKGNFEKAFDIKDKAQKARDDAAKSAGTIGVNLEQIAAQREQTAAGREATAEARRSGNLAQIENARTRALAQATRDIAARIKEIESMGSLGGGKLPPPVQAELAQLRQQRDLIVDQVNMRFDQMAAQAGGGAGSFKVIGVKPGS